ncbi:hypothetical protein ABT061_15740 [Streptosporangium sp. NPDC002544]|uniref:hypothetical protein n=1 Tax=Streptosporangium sp. NPDC002544 TaxID=3154538 RepID=UPI00333088E2
MSLTCPVPSCVRTMPGHLRVCRACSTDLLRDLRDVPSLARHLEEAATRQVRLGTPGGGPRREEPVPWDDRARTAQHALRTVLVGWVRVLQHGVRPYEGPTCQDCAHRSCIYISLGRSPADTMPAMAVWLIRHRAILLGRHSAPEAIDGIREAIRQARRAIDRPADRIYAGPCNECGADLLAKPGARTIVCRPCAMIYDIGPRLEWMRRQVETTRGTATWVATAATTLGYDATPAGVRGLAHRLRLFAYGVDQLGRPLYRVGHVLDLLDGETGERLAGPACAACHHATCRRVRQLDAEQGERHPVIS